MDGDVIGARLAAAIAAAGGPAYTYVEVEPVDDQDGGIPGGNIRVAYLYDAERVELAPSGEGRAGGPLEATQVEAAPDGGVRFTLNPGAASARPAACVRVVRAYQPVAERRGVRAQAASSRRTPRLMAHASPSPRISSSSPPASPSTSSTTTFRARAAPTRCTAPSSRPRTAARTSALRRRASSTPSSTTSSASTPPPTWWCWVT